MNAKSSLFLAAVILISPLLALAHGEDKPGPNGGFIQMPGAFHTELVPVDKSSLKIYLLDMQWKNPSVADSSVKLTFKRTNATCEKQTDHYLCKFKEAMDLNKKGELVLTAKRENAQGNRQTYALPLSRAEAVIGVPAAQPPAAQPPADPHKGHH